MATRLRFHGFVFLLFLLGISLFVSLYNPCFFDSFPLLFLLLFPAPNLIALVVDLCLIRPIPQKWRTNWRFISFLDKAASAKRLLAGFILVVGVFGALGGYRAWVDRQPVSPVKPRLLVLGLDGATWSLIDPMIKSGDLPTLESLCAGGTRGVLQSLEPMQSPDLWTSIATGLPADKHGISGFFCTRADLKANRVWDIARRRGLATGLFSWLATWPPCDPFAFIIPSWMARTPETKPFEYACIQELTIEQSLYGGPNNPIDNVWQCVKKGARLRGVEREAWFFLRDKFGLSEEARLAAKMMAETRLQTDLFISLMRRFQPDIAAFTLYGTDKLAHRFWHYMNPEEFPDLNVKEDNPYREVIRDYYRRADAELGRILQTAPPECNVLLVSDHGFKADANSPQQYFLDVPRLLETLGVLRLVHYFSIERQVILEPIVPGSQFVERLKDDLETIHFPDSEDPVFLAETPGGRRIALQPNFSLTWHEESPLATHQFLVISGRTYPVERFFFVRTFSGTHDPAGIVLLKGPAFRPGAILANANLLDLAPTMLYLLDLPISRELTGRIFREAVSDEFSMNHAAQYIDSYGEPPRMPEESTDMPESLMEHLRSLDYVK
jgi:predicted AlkP superfamily phosphohydrolase/phosphomutase